LPAALARWWAMRERRGKVYLVGAGPGASDLITMRGAECLRRADTVIYDYLANPDLLRLAPAKAALLPAGDIRGSGRRIDQDALNQVLIARARRGETVVRLKGGDPFIFGRGGEEAEALAHAGVAFEVVPGVTSAIAAPTYAGIPLTHRRYGSFVAFLTGHRGSSKKSSAPVPWKELAAAAKRGGTLVLLMASERMRDVLGELVKAGLASRTPAAAIQWATTASQRTVRATLATLAARCEREKLGAPAVIVVGECAGLRDQVKWFEAMPLFGKRIVVTRARDAASGFAADLRALGADVIEFPTIEFAPPTSYAALDRAIARLGKFDWVIFTSATGVDAFIARVKRLGHDIREMSRASIGAIGPATAERVRAYALRVAAMPEEYRAEAIVPAIGRRRIRGTRILIPRAQVAREALPEILRGAGAREVAVVHAYRTVRPKVAAADRVREMAAAGEIDLVTFTSSSTVTNFCAMVGEPTRPIKAAAIGPITAQTAEKKGFEVVVRPMRYTVPALAAAICDYFSGRAGAS